MVSDSAYLCGLEVPDMARVMFDCHHRTPQCSTRTVPHSNRVMQHPCVTQHRCDDPAELRSDEFFFPVLTLFEACVVDTDPPPRRNDSSVSQN